MSRKFVAAVAVLTITSPFAFGQSQTAPKASKADVEAVIATIKNDKAKFAQFCEITKLDVQSQALAQKNQNDPKLEALGKKMDAIAAKLGPDYLKILNSELDEATGALFDDLSKSCNVGFKAAQAAPKVSKSDVQKLVDSIENDKTKLGQFCEVTKLANQAGTLFKKNQNDPKLAAISKKIGELNSKLGADYQRVTTSDLDQGSVDLLDNLYKSCQ